MKKRAFNPEEHGEGLECVICMEEYKETDEVIELPCNEKHFFHSKCITDWLNSNNSCPLCKKPITKEDLQKQKKESKQSRNLRRSTVRSNNR